MGNGPHKIKHSPASLLEARYFEATSRYRGAADQICTRAIDLYVEEVEADYRTINLQHVGPNDDPDKVIRNNIKRIQAFFDADKCKYHRAEFFHFIARAMDELFDMGVCRELEALMFPVQAPQTASLQQGITNLNRESHEVLQSLLSALEDGEIDASERKQILSEIADVERVAKQIRQRVTDRG